MALMVVVMTWRRGRGLGQEGIAPTMPPRPSAQVKLAATVRPSAVSAGYQPRPLTVH